MSGMLHRDMTVDLVGGRALFLPTSARLHKKQPVAYCQNIVTAEGEQCLLPFFSFEERNGHVPGCSAQHASAINAYRLRTHPEIMRTWDTDLEDWISRNRDAVLEGRKTI